MHATTFRRPSFRLAALLPVLALAAATGACDDDPVGHEDKPEVQTIVLTVGSQTVRIDAATGASGPIVIGLGAHPVSATFLRADGQPETGIHADEFELHLDIQNTSIATFSRTGAFTGTLTGQAAGTTAVKVELFHIEEGHGDFEQSLTLTVQ